MKETIGVLQMIKEKQALDMQGANKILGSLKETDKIKDTKAFIKKFSKITPDKTEKLKQELQKLDILKIKDKDIVKIIDILPEDAAELNKIFTEVTLDADETSKILATVKNNK